MPWGKESGHVKGLIWEMYWKESLDITEKVGVVDMWSNKVEVL